MSAENKYLKFIFSFESGEQVMYEDITHTMRVTEMYQSPFLVAPTNNIGAACECEHVLHISTTSEIAHENYLNFQGFCESVLNRRKQLDDITNICVITSDGEAFYNISKENLAGLRIGGNSDNGVLYFNLEIFFDKGE